MKKLLRSTFGTLVVATFLAVAPPMYARGGHGGGHGGHRGGHGGHGVKHAAAGHVKADTAAFVFAVGVVANLSGLRAAARVMQGADITELAAIAGEAGEVTMDIGTMDIPAIVWAITARATAIRITVITDTTLGDIILTATDTGRP